jgi:transcriptional regulator with XRE-family HTH domain
VANSDPDVTPISDEVKRFGYEIRRRRQSLDLSLADLAHLVGLTSNFIGTIENGTRNPSISTVLSLARGLGVPAAELIAEAHGLGPPGLEVARLFSQLSPVVQDRFIELLRLICVRQEAVRPPMPPPSSPPLPSSSSPSSVVPTPPTVPTVTRPASDTDESSEEVSEASALNTPR